MYSLVLFASLAMCAWAGTTSHASVQSTGPMVVPYAAAPIIATPQVAGTAVYRTQDVLGRYSYGFASTDGIGRSEARAQDGTVTGSYNYISPEGKPVRIAYTAGAEGFQPVGDVIPEQVSASAEVEQATEQHLKAKAGAAVRTSALKPLEIRPAPIPVAASSYSYSGNYPYVVPYNYYPTYAHYPLVYYKNDMNPVNQFGYSYAYTN